MSEYIKPRKKKENESRKTNLLRKIEENIEFFHACNNKSMVGTLEEILNYIYHSDPPKKGEYICPKCGIRNDSMRSKVETGEYDRW